MSDVPKITIVTPSFNQARFIAETLDSVAAQDYPNLEHIVMDGGSTDGTLEILKRYPSLRVVSERDRGQGDAINKGFRLATGDIWGFLNSDDTLLPGALHRVAKEIDPAAGRHIVMGRCRFIDEHGRYLGIEHPSRFESFTRVLEVWKGHTIPQPAVFWTPEVWRGCGGLDESLKYHLDYELFCRFAKQYRFHFVDQILATYRLHAESKTEGWTEADRLDDSIRLSRRFWGPPWSPRRWRLASSLWWYRFDRVGRARRLYGRAREARRQHSPARALLLGTGAAGLAPEVSFYLGIYPALRAAAQGRVGQALLRMLRPPRVHLQTTVYLDRSEPWPDGWIGPRLVVVRSIAEGCRQLVVRGRVDQTYFSDPFVLVALIDGAPLGSRPVEASGFFSVAYDLPGTLGHGPHTLELRASAYFVPHTVNSSGDYRPLSWRAASREAIVFASAAVRPMPVEHGANRPSPGVLWFADGWREPEGPQLDWLRWTSERGMWRVTTAAACEAMLRGEALGLRRENQACFAVNGQKLASIDLPASAFEPFALRVPLVGGENVIEIMTTQPPIVPPGDTRPLAVAVRHVSIELPA